MRRLNLLLLTCIIFLTQHSIAGELPLRSLTLTGTGEVNVAADQVVVQMQVNTLHKSATEAKTLVDQRLNAFLDLLPAIGISEKDIVASTLRLNPNFDYQNRQQIFTGYRAERDLSVTLRDISALDKLLTLAVDSGINQISRIALENSEAEKHQQQAHQLAIADSRQKAEALARAYQVELGPVVSIGYDNNQPLTGPMPERMMQAAASDAASGGRYLHDEISYRDSIQVTFELIVTH